jgi:hypothetical protein
VLLGCEDWLYETELHVCFAVSMSSFLTLIMVILFYSERTTRTSLTSSSGSTGQYVPHVHCFRSTASLMRGLTA